MLDIYEVLGIERSTPDDEVRQVYEGKLAEWQRNKSEEDVKKLKREYYRMDARNKDFAKNRDDVKRCLANAQKGLEKLQTILESKSSKEYIEIRARVLLSMIQTEQYYLGLFKKYCLRHNFVLQDINESDFYLYFEEMLETEYIKKFDPQRGKLEHWVNHTMTRYRFPDILEKIKEEARAGDVSIEKIREPRGNDGFEFDFYEVLVSISRLMVAMQQHLKQTESFYYALFFTETVSMVAIAVRDDGYRYVDSEEQLFCTMNIKFLDFYTEEICRTLKEISESPLKFYRDIGIDKDGRIELTPAVVVKSLKVYCAFIKSISEDYNEDSVKSTISQQKNSYYKKLAALKELYYESFLQYSDTTSVYRASNGRMVQSNL